MCTEIEWLIFKYIQHLSKGSNPVKFLVSFKISLFSEPMEFGGDMSDGLTVFCKNVASSCIFPFIHNDVTYNSCTTDDMDQLEGEKK